MAALVPASDTIAHFSSSVDPCHSRHGRGMGRVGEHPSGRSCHLPRKTRQCDTLRACVVSVPGCNRHACWLLRLWLFSSSTLDRPQVQTRTPHTPGTRARTHALYRPLLPCSTGTVPVLLATSLSTVRPTRPSPPRHQKGRCHLIARCSACPRVCDREAAGPQPAIRALHIAHHLPGPTPV